MNMHSLIVAAGMASVLASTPVALAQQSDPDPAPWITMKTTNGCTFYLYDYEDPAGTWQKQWPWTWSGACTGGVATGPGDLEAAMSSDGGHKYRSGYRGMMVGGRLNGRVEEITDGKMLADYYWQTFEMGCGTAGHFVYCQPFTGRVETKAAPPVTTGGLSAKQLIASDPAAIRADLNVSTEDRIIAVLQELATTGQFNLLQQANAILARRFPNSPFLAIAMDMVTTLNNGDAWSPQKTGSSTPVSVKAAPSPSASAPAPLAGALTVEQVKAMLERLGYAPKNIADPGEAALYEFDASRDGLTIPVAFSVSPNQKYIWAQVRLLTTAVPQPVSVAAMTRAVDIQPAMFWTRSNGLWLGMSKDNRGVMADDLRDMIDTVLQNTVATQDIWGR